MLKIFRQLRIRYKNNRQKVGEHLIRRGLKKFLNSKNSSGKWYLHRGLELITCDCFVKTWIEQHKIEIKKQLNKLNDFENDYLFIQGYLKSHIEDTKQLNNGLIAIQKYLEFSSDEFGHYVKGQILTKLNKPQEALKSYETSKKIKITSILEFKIGYLKENILKESGIQELYNSLMINKSSICCIVELQKHSFNKNYFLSNKNNNMLISLFNSDSFGNDFSNLYKHQLILSENHRRLNYKTQRINDFSNELILNEFLKTLTKEVQLYLDPNYNFLKKKFNSTEKTSNYIMFKENNNNYYNDQLDLDQQSPEFWDNL
ncbi:hypothetical protein [uncultured Polaribacter sp.]|uniref:hypothetical protein n=1 Tax=uncultured Polaribacter sp. TaxID=174711 RepID=UPI002611928E|nr:hypothetical protein [uncultured Polaribacter sp.]